MISEPDFVTKFLISSLVANLNFNLSNPQPLAKLPLERLMQLK